MAGATLCSIILGSDKTTVSVATGQNDYWPLYISNGLIHNNVRRAHRNGLTLVGFLAVPKSESTCFAFLLHILITFHCSGSGLHKLPILSYLSAKAVS